MEGSSVDQRHRFQGTSWPDGAGRRRLGVARLLVVLVVAAVGVASIAAAFAGLSLTVSRGESLVRQSGTTEQQQRFAFDRLAWQALAVDDIFPLVYRTTTAAPLEGVERQFTRIGVAPRTDCHEAFEPALLRLLGPVPCGPVLRADYTDASSTLVATLGIAFLGTSIAGQRTANAATEGPRDDLRPHAVAFPGTSADAFGDPQRLASRALAAADAPLLTFAVVGFSDGRPASVDAGSNALRLSGATTTVLDLDAMLDRRLASAVDSLWARSR
jgi:hypothetical protein